MDISSAQPIIVVGMHRSGTSLLTRLLQDMGVFIGADCGGKHSESESMRELNETLLARIGASWFQPEAAECLLNSKNHNPEILEEFRSSVDGALRNYAGDHYASISDSSLSWGWKDPRTTLTLPIWLSVFHKAKVIDIVRNGVDVAQSLVTRDNRERRHVRNCRIKGLCRRDIVRRVVRRLHRDADKQSARHSQRKYFDLSTAFSVWAHYLNISRRCLESVDPAQRLSLRYEDLLNDSQIHLEQIHEFVGVDNVSASVDVAASIDAGRSIAFARDRKLRKFYQKVRSHPRMVEHGYANLT